MTHFYSKGVHGTAQFFSKPPPRSNPFLFFLSMIMEDQIPFFSRRQLVETSVKTCGTPLELIGVWRYEWGGNRLRFRLEEDLFRNPVDIKGRVTYIILEKPVDFDRGYVEALIEEVFRVTTPLGRKYSD